MEIRDAAAMLKNAHLDASKKTVWADLGCGSGTFTMALASFLLPGSLIYAIDSNATSLQQIPAPYRGVDIQKYKADFINDALPFNAIDGILMANALHYVQHKNIFLQKVATGLKEDGCFLIVEYDTDQPVPVWVPFPVSFGALQRLSRDAGLGTVMQLSKRPSVYGHAPLYAAVIKR